MKTQEVTSSVHVILKLHLSYANEHIDQLTKNSCLTNKKKIEDLSPVILWEKCFFNCLRFMLNVLKRQCNNWLYVLYITTIHFQHKKFDMFYDVYVIFFAILHSYRTAAKIHWWWEFLAVLILIVPSWFKQIKYLESIY